MRIDSARLLSGGIVIALLACGAGAAEPPAGALATGVPDAVLQGALAGSAEGTAPLRAFLAGRDAGAPDRSGVVHRARAIFGALEAQRETAGPQALLRAIDRVTVAATTLIAEARLLRLGVDPEYAPAAGSVALDFGPAEGPVARGFARIVAASPEVGGPAMQGLHRPHESDLLADGLRGVERIVIDLAEGAHRLLLITRKLDDPGEGAGPFGREIRVNGVSIFVERPGDLAWVPSALMTGRARALPGTQQFGFVTGSLSDQERGLIERQQGGAIALQLRSESGRAVIEFRDFGPRGTFISGLVTEPASAPSAILLSDEGLANVLALDRIAALEAEILALASALLQRVSPEAQAGDAPPLPAPVLPPALFASPS